MKEIARVTKPGATFFLTLEPRRFMDFIAAIPEATEHEWCRMLSSHKPRLQEFYQDFDAGNLVFMPTNEGMESTYGDAVVPLSYIERHWQPYSTSCGISMMNSSSGRRCSSCGGPTLPYRTPDPFRHAA